MFIALPPDQYRFQPELLLVLPRLHLWCYRGPFVTQGLSQQRRLPFQSRLGSPDIPETLLLWDRFADGSPILFIKRCLRPSNAAIVGCQPRFYQPSINIAIDENDPVR